MSDDNDFLDAIDALRRVSEPDVFCALSPEMQQEVIEAVRDLSLNVNKELLRRTPGWPPEGGDA